MNQKFNIVIFEEEMCIVKKKAATVEAKTSGVVSTGGDSVPQFKDDHVNSITVCREDLWKLKALVLNLEEALKRAASEGHIKNQEGECIWDKNYAFIIVNNNRHVAFPSPEFIVKEGKSGSVESKDNQPS